MKRLRTLLEFIFGCRHRHLSRVFTIRHRTYCVCIEYGREFDLPDPFVEESPDASPATRLRSNLHPAH